MSSQLEAARVAHPSDSDMNRVVRIADDLIREWDVRLPVSLDLVAGLQGVDVVERVPLDAAACLIPEPGAMRIKLRASDSPRRQNFSGLHEVGHTFMPGYQLQMRFRCDPAHAHAGPRDLEGLCDVAAAELLLPARYFAGDAAASSMDFDSVQDLSNAYEASIEATARRLVAFATEPSVLIRLEVGNKPQDRPGAPPCLRASNFHPATAISRSIPRFKSLDGEDAVQAVLHNGVFSGPSRLTGLVDAPEPLHVEALDCPWSDGRTGQQRSRVLLIATARRPAGRPA